MPRPLRKLPGTGSIRGASPPPDERGRSCYSESPVPYSHLVEVQLFTPKHQVDPRCVTFSPEFAGSQGNSPFSCLTSTFPWGSPILREGPFLNLELLLQLPLCRTQLCVVTKLGLPRRLRRFLYPLPRLLRSVEARIFQYYDGGGSAVSGDQAGSSRIWASGTREEGRRPCIGLTRGGGSTDSPVHLLYLYRATLAFAKMLHDRWPSSHLRHVHMRDCHLGTVVRPSSAEQRGRQSLAHSTFPTDCVVNLGLRKQFIEGHAAPG